jgi:type VI secretion system protein ImpK
MTDGVQSSMAEAQRAGRGPRLLDAFRELYAEVAKNAHALSAPEGPEPEAVKQRLLTVLARQTADAQDRLTEHELIELDEAQYVMVAMADEVFLHLDWVGRDEWTRRPLEAEARFGTHVAGERIFNRLEEIFRDRLSVSGDLLCVYLAALSLGFRGRYRFDPRSPDPERVRHELIRELRRVEPRMVAPAAELCPEAVAGVRDKEPRRGLSNLREGLLPLVGVLAGMALLGHLLWYYQTSEVRDKLDRIELGKNGLANARAKQKALKKQDAALESATTARPPEPEAPAGASDGGAP